MVTGYTDTILPSGILKWNVMGTHYLEKEGGRHYLILLATERGIAFGLRLPAMMLEKSLNIT